MEGLLSQKRVMARCAILKGGRWKLAHDRVEGNAEAHVCVTKKKTAQGDGQKSIALHRAGF
jgi:hypothetical protein